MRTLKANNKGLLGTCLALLIALGGYIFARFFLLAEVDMTSKLQKAVPRVHGFAQHFSNARAFVPAILSPSPSLTNQFSTSTASMTHDTLTFKEAVQHRRTIYQLQKKSPISDERIKEILTFAIKDVPSSFNSQSSRIIALLHDQHDKFWDIVEDKLRPLVDKDNWQKTADRVAGFRQGYATVRPINTLSKISMIMN